MKSSHIHELNALLGDTAVLADPETLSNYRFDRWVVKHLRDWRGETVTEPGCVIRPRTTDQVQDIVRYCNDHEIKLIPYGLGSGVCGGIEPSNDQVLIDMSAMNSVTEIDSVNMLATFEAGVRGIDAEHAANECGLTIGHWPQSIDISSVGGWVSTRASGQFSSAYGNIEDMIYSIEAVLPNGEIVTLGKGPRAATGPDLRHVFMGAEGTMGIITKVTLSLRKQAEQRACSAYYVATMENGFEVQRRIIQAGWEPPVMRLYDSSEVARLFSNHTYQDHCLLLMVHEGPTERVQAERDVIARTISELALPASASITEQWLERRNHVPEWTDLLDQGLIADTIEVSAKWTEIGAVYTKVVEALQTVPFCVNASAHSSHTYRSGINLYFTFACMPPSSDEMEALYFESWDKAMNATAAAGGSIAHHHGSGRLRRSYLHHDLGTSGLKLLRSMKDAIDPKGIMNAGNLLE